MMKAMEKMRKVKNEMEFKRIKKADDEYVIKVFYYIPISD